MYTGKCLSPERSGIVSNSRDYNEYCCLWHFVKKLRARSSSKMADRMLRHPIWRSGYELILNGRPDVRSSEMADRMWGHPRWPTGCDVRGIDTSYPFTLLMCKASVWYSIFLVCTLGALATPWSFPRNIYVTCLYIRLSNGRMFLRCYARFDSISVIVWRLKNEEDCPIQGSVALIRR